MSRSGFIRTAWACIFILIGPVWGAAQGAGGEGGGLRGVVAALDVVLYWDSRRYDRLVDGGDLATVRDQLREVMNYDCGTLVSEISEGLGEFITASAYANQYPSDAGRRHDRDSGHRCRFGLRFGTGQGLPCSRSLRAPCTLITIIMIPVSGI